MSTQNIFVSCDMPLGTDTSLIMFFQIGTAKASKNTIMFYYCSSVHMQNRGEYQQSSFPFNLSREGIRLLGKRPSSEEIDTASFPGSPPYKRNAME